ncbi:MAG: hypothetical protein AAGM67_02290, partial [Bacteroidota bacterium]
VSGSSESDDSLIQLQQARMFQPLVLAYQQEKAMLLDRLPEWIEELETIRQGKSSFPEHLHLEVLSERLYEIERSQREDPLASLQLQIERSQSTIREQEQQIRTLRQAFLAFFDLKGPFQAFHEVAGLDFVQSLRDFMQASELEEIREQLGIKHSQLLSRLVEQIPSFQWQDAAELQLADWNERYFANQALQLIRKPHPLLTIFADLKRFQAAFVAELGAPSLFSQATDSEDRNQEALTLLDGLYQELLAYPSMMLQAEDLLQIQWANSRPDQFPADWPESRKAQLRLDMAQILLEAYSETAPPIFLWPDANHLPKTRIEQTFAECEKIGTILLMAGFMGEEVM